MKRNTLTDWPRGKFLVSVCASVHMCGLQKLDRRQVHNGFMYSCARVRFRCWYMSFRGWDKKWAYHVCVCLCVCVAVHMCGFQRLTQTFPHPRCWWVVAELEIVLTFWGHVKDGMMNVLLRKGHERISFGKNFIPETSSWQTIICQLWEW